MNGLNAVFASSFAPLQLQWNLQKPSPAITKTSTVWTKGRNP